MDNVPTPTNPVDRAEQALRHFGAVDRPTAEALLSMWAHVKDLTAAQRAEVLDRFGEGHDVPLSGEPELAYAKHQQVYWRGYAHGFEDACRPDPDRKAAWSAGYVTGTQLVIDAARQGSDEKEVIMADEADRRLGEAEMQVFMNDEATQSLAARIEAVDREMDAMRQKHAEEMAAATAALDAALAEIERLRGLLDG